MGAKKYPLAAFAFTFMLLAATAVAVLSAGPRQEWVAECPVTTIPRPAFVPPEPYPPAYPYDYCETIVSNHISPV